MATDPIRVEYNQDLRALALLLSGVKRAGDFFVAGVVEIPMPRIEVTGVGVLSFPVPAAQVAALLRTATRAPYGRGRETVLDESVRKVWQVPPAKLRMGGKSWAASFDAILKQVVTGLGCDGRAVSAELYKLLVYDKGGFFLTHRDTEKAGGMFGTLIVSLPSTHRGGDLVIRHAGRVETVDLSTTEASEVRFAAFYADCEHEVHAITHGNRVCLVYNLIQRRSAKGRRQTLHAPDDEPQIARAATLLDRKLSTPGAPVKIAWLLDHQYSPDGLTFPGLKSVDAARVKIMVQAAARAACTAYLGIVHIEESGAAELRYDSYRPRRWRRHYDDQDETGDVDSGDFEVIEVSEYRHYIAQWRDQRDRAVDLGEIPLAPGELIPDGALDDEPPDEQRLTEATGNEGASFERSYHRAALVLWRRDRHAEVLLQAGVAAALPYLKERVEACRARRAPPSAREQTVALAGRVVHEWTVAPEDRGAQLARPNKRDVMLRLLVKLGDSALLARFVAGVVTRDYDGSENAALVRAARLLGAEQTGGLLSELVRRQMEQVHGHCVDLLLALASGRGTFTTPDWRGAMRDIAHATVCALDDVGRKQSDDWRTDWRVKEHPVNAALVATLLDALGGLGASDLRAEAAERFTSRSEVFDPVTILVPALALVREQDAAVTRLWEHCAEFLLRRSGRPPDAPTDWRQDAKLSCSCSDCRELLAFARDPVERTHRFSVRQDRRRHLHQAIERHRLDMTHVTERKGSPQTLVCTKDRRSYQRRCEQYRQDVAALAALVKLAGSGGAAGESVERVEAARALAAEWSPA